MKHMCNSNTTLSLPGKGKRAMKPKRTREADRKKEQRRRQRNIRLVGGLKANAKCMDCGVEGLPAYCYDYDHRDPRTKRASVSQLVNQSKGIQRILLEIAKCDLVCANCHRIRNWGPEKTGGEGGDGVPPNQRTLPLRNPDAIGHDIECAMVMWGDGCTCHRNTGRLTNRGA